MNEDRLFQKVYGCLIGGLIGDAMGAPVEGKHYRDIEAQFGEIHDFQGSGTDDSAIKLILCDAILANGGWVTADEFAEAFLRHEEYYKLFFIPVKNMLHKIKAGLTLPVYAGLGNMQSSSSAMAISPMGLINACNPRQAAAETYDVAGLIHAGDTTFCRDGACAIAAAVAEAMKADATVDSVVEASTAYLHRKSSRVMIERIEETVALAKTAGDYKGFRKEFYERFLQDIICDSRETVPCVLSLFLLAEGDPVKSILDGANFGRDADTISTMVGAISGAFKGYGGLKREWVDRIRSANPEQGELAGRIANVIRLRADSVKSSLAMLDELGR
jgi:ADP-ribosylglycohydrolase